MELLVGAAIQIVRRDNLVADLRDGQEGQRLGGLAGRDPEGAGSPFDGREALFEDIGGGIHDARVDVAELLQGKEIGGVVGALEDVRGRLVDRHRAGAGGRIGDLAGVQGQRAQVLGWNARNQFVRMVDVCSVSAPGAGAARVEAQPRTACRPCRFRSTPNPLGQKAVSLRTHT